MSYYKTFKNIKADRDAVFQDALSYLNKKPATILEIGCLRDLRPEAKRGDGWSSMHFAEYIDLYGGELIVCDISQDSINACQKALEEFDIKKSFHCVDAMEFLKECDVKSFDFVFLDGGDDPNQMLDQFNTIKDKSNLILCDDYHAKGSLMKQSGIESITYTWLKHEHQLALIYKNVTNSIKNIG